MKPLYRYILGFILSILLTLLAFGLVNLHESTGHVFPSHAVAVPVLVALAIAQLAIQLILFLHLGSEEKPRWNLMAFIFALFVVVILVGGTLWIMSNLSHGQHQNLESIYKNGVISPYNQDD